MTDFQLHKRLEADTYFIMDLNISRVLLMNDKRYPWLILVPRQSDLREIHQLGTADQHRLIDEICSVSQTLEHTFEAVKMNVGALGNMVPQLHIHVVVRQENDKTWPGPVWGVGNAIPYSTDEADKLCNQMRQLISV